MSEIVNNLDAANAVSIFLNEIDAIKAQLAKLEIEKSNQPPISDEQLSELEQDTAYSVAELDQLKSSVPEGYVDDSNVQYFLAVGEIQKSNEVLRQQLEFSQRNLESTKNDVKETKELIKNLEEINKEVKIAHDKRKDEKKKNMMPEISLVPMKKQMLELKNLEQKHKGFH